MRSGALITSYHGPARILREATLSPMREYADRHGYDIFEAPVVHGIPVVWWSMRGVLDALRRGHDRVLWMDADILVLDSAEDIMAPESFRGWHFFAKDDRCGLLACLWGVRQCAEAHAYIERVWARRNAAIQPDQEQGALREELDRPTLLGEPWFARYGLIGPGARFAHGGSTCGTWEQRRDYLLRRPVHRDPIPSIARRRVRPLDGPYDSCGPVSALLMAAGLLDRPIRCGDFLAWGEPGIGEHLTVWANEAHVFVEMFVNGEMRHFGAYADCVGLQAELHDHAGFEPRRPSR